MPRQRRRRKPRQAPPNVMPNFQLPPQPDFKVLKNALSGVVNAAIESRIQAMIEVVNWYGQAADYLIAKSQVVPKLGDEIRPKLEKLTRANKLRELGINTGAQLPERELALRRSIEQYEQYVNTPTKDAAGNLVYHIKGLPIAFKPYYDQYELKRPQLEAKQKEFDNRYAMLADTFGKIFPDAGLKFKVSPTVEGRRFDSGVVSFGKDAARDMLKVIKNDGILKLFNQEVVQIAKFAATVDNGQGGVMVDGKKFIENINSMLQKFVVYCQSKEAPARVIRKVDPTVVHVGATPKPAAQPQAPRAPRPAGFAKHAGPKVAGRWVQGSSIALAYEALAKGGVFSKEELQALSGAKWIINHLVKEAKKYGDFKIENKGGKFSMTGGTI